MIKANELRIGNWVKWDNADNYYQLEEIKENSGDDIDPIPLTPEILEQCGFEHFENWNRNHWSSEKMFGCVYLANDGYYVEDFEGGDITEKPIKYLHQFQNLYFALTGEELEYKPEIAISERNDHNGPNQES